MSAMADEIRKVLLVEDDQDHAELTVSILQDLKRRDDYQFRVDVAKTGEECLKAISDDQYDTILLDYSLPRMSGIEVLEKIRGMGIETPVIIVTGYGDEKVAVNSMKSGAYDYVVKEQGYLKSLPNVLRRVIDQYGQMQEKRCLEERLEKYQIELEMSRRLASIGEMVARIAHEIKNPLSRIRMGIDCITEQLNNDPSTKKSVEGILNGLETLNAIATDMLNYAKPISMELQNLDVNKTVDCSISALSDRIREDGVVIKRQYNTRLGSINMDGVRMKEVFVNIISNALDAMPSGGTLLIKTFRTKEEGMEYITFSFTDSGSGIDDRDIEKIFNPFYTTKSQGTGLGLAIVKKIVELHGGRIVVTSRKGEGTTFTVKLRRS